MTVRFPFSRLLAALLVAALSLPAAALARTVEEPAAKPDLEQVLGQGRDALQGADFAGALAAFRLAAGEGSAHAFVALGEMYEHGLGVVQSDKDAVVLYRRALAAGDAEAGARLGLLLFTRASAGQEAKHGVRDVFEGLDLIRRAAAQGNAFGQYALGTLHLNGMAMPHDIDKARRLLEAAAAQDLAVAQSALGQMYLDGRGVQSHPGMAVELLTEAARKGDVPAQTRLGVLYRDGWGTERHDAEAAYWFERAADRGDAEAMGHLAQMLLEGREVRADLAKAIDLLRESAKAGYAPAQYQLGLSLLEGRGVLQDREQGLRWIREAVGKGYAAAKKFMELASH